MSSRGRSVRSGPLLLVPFLFHPGCNCQGSVYAPDATCGDGFVADDEVCDGERLRDETCESLGFDQGGTLTCAFESNRSRNSSIRLG